MLLAAAEQGCRQFTPTSDHGPRIEVVLDVLANLTKVRGQHAYKFGVYYQNSFKPQSIFSGFNSEINFIDDGNNPFDTGYAYANAATGVFNTYTQASRYAVPEWRYTNFEWYVQDNWKLQHLTLDYGVRFYHLSPQYDASLAASDYRTAISFLRTQVKARSLVILFTNVLDPRSAKELASAISESVMRFIAPPPLRPA